MSDQTNVDFNLIARQQAKVMTEVGSMRDDMTVMMAILQRLDGSVTGLANEVRATHTRQSRPARRITALEGGMT